MYSDFHLISIIFKSKTQSHYVRSIYNTWADFPKIGKNKIVLINCYEGICVTENCLICFSILDADLVPIAIAPPKNIKAYIGTSCFIEKDELYLFAVKSRENQENIYSAKNPKLSKLNSKLNSNVIHSCCFKIWRFDEKGHTPITLEEVFDWRIASNIDFEQFIGVHKLPPMIIHKNSLWPLYP